VLPRETCRSKVRASTLVLSVILLIGGVAMAYRYFHNNSEILYLGLFITGATSFSILVQALISQNGTRRV
jgi:hypothetical protein